MHGFFGRVKLIFVTATGESADFRTARVGVPSLSGAHATEGVAIGRGPPQVCTDKETTITVPYGCRLNQRVVVSAAWIAVLCASVTAQNLNFSTHDWTENIDLLNPFVETWADVKTPGGNPRFLPAGGGLVPDERRTYVVGTIEVEKTLLGSEFSEFPAVPDGLIPFSVIIPGQQNRRQVVMLQSNHTDFGTDAFNQPYPNGIAWQRYFYGETGSPLDPDLTRATNARAVSVWEAPPNAEGERPDTRVAICGETYDERLVLCPFEQESGWAAANAGHPSGFIAVYDGDGTLLWTYHFFAGTDPTANCAVTDISIRVDGEGVEWVTYCGIFSHGDPGPGTQLSPLLPFDSPVLPGLSAGDTTYAAGQWDGFVGRLKRVGGSTTRVFHSIVGGPGQDGLFGLAEIDEDRFAVVGGTQAGVGEEGFPISLSGTSILVAPYYVGAVLIFDASATPSGDLVLDSSSALGAQTTTETHTLARDVCIGWDVGFFEGDILDVRDVLYVVGSTDDTAFETSAGVPFLQAPMVGQGVFGGATDAFVAVFRDTPGLMLPQTWAYWGGAGTDGFTGVNCWNEFSEHIVAAGFTAPAESTSHDIVTASYFFNNAFGGPPIAANTSPPNNSLKLLPIRNAIIGGTSDDRPAVMGMVNATDDVLGSMASLTFETEGLGYSAGGGVAVGNDGRTDVVGRTRPTGGGYPVIGAQARGPDLGIDAVRTELDLVPASPPTLPGVGRTDGTGFQGNGAAFPLVGYTGGTTPACGLAQFGRRIGEPLPSMTRMLIDYEGSPPASSVDDLAILVTRPTTYLGSWAVGVLWINLPLTTGAPVINGVEFWGDPVTWVLVMDAWPGSRAYRLRLHPNLATSQTVSAQLYCLLDLTPGAGPVLGATLVDLTPGVAGCESEFTASPALWFSY